MHLNYMRKKDVDKMLKFIFEGKKIDLIKQKVTIQWFKTIVHAM